MLEQTGNRHRAIGRQSDFVTGLEFEQERAQLEGRSKQVKKRREVDLRADLLHPADSFLIAAGAMLEYLPGGKEYAQPLLLQTQRRFSQPLENGVVISGVRIA